jgi:hypothetical protein
VKLVEVHWLDITTHAGWCEELVINNKDMPLEFVTVGYLVKKTKDRIVISDTSPTIGNITIFPRGCVVSLVYKK